MAQGITTTYIYNNISYGVTYFTDLYDEFEYNAQPFTYITGDSTYIYAKLHVDGNTYLHGNISGNDIYTNVVTNNSIGIGTYITATGTYSAAFGIGAISEGYGSHAEGGNTNATYIYSHAEGFKTTASHTAAHAEGINTKAEAIASHSEGSSTIAVGSASHAEGSNTTAGGMHSHSEGQGTIAAGNVSHAEGTSTTALGNNSHTEGKWSTAIGDYSHSEGYNTTSFGDNSHAEGISNDTPIAILSVDYNRIQLSTPTTETMINMLILQNGITYKIIGIDNDKYIVNSSGLIADTPQTVNVLIVNEKIIKLSIAAVSSNIGAVITQNGVNYIITDVNGDFYFVNNIGIVVDNSNTTTITKNTAILKAGSIGIASHTEGNTTIAAGDYSHAEGNSTITLGEYSHSEGINTTASGTASHAEGSNTNAQGAQSHTEGINTTASGTASHAEGSNTNAQGAQSHTEGINTTASGDQSHAEGSNTNAQGVQSHTEGISTTASGNQSHAEGSNNTAIGAQSHAEGSNTNAQGAQSHAEGLASKALGSSSHSEGNSTTASGDYSHAEGTESSAAGTGSHAEGKSHISVNGNYAHSEGYETNASSTASHSEGHSTAADGAASHAEGSSTRAIGAASHSEGLLTNAVGLQSHAEGNTTHAAGLQSHAEGNTTFAIGKSSHSEGTDTFALGISSHVEGTGSKTTITVTATEGVFATVDKTLLQSISIGAMLKKGDNYFSVTSINYDDGILELNGALPTIGDVELITGAFATSSHVEGYGAIANGAQSHAEGSNTIASGNNSHAEGYNTQSLNESTHSEGSWTVASGIRGHAEGLNSIASGPQSHAEGNHTSAVNHSEHASGQYNVTYTHADSNGNFGPFFDSTLFTIGNGTETTPSNAVQVMQTGDTYIFGKLYVEDGIQSTFTSIGNKQFNSDKSIPYDAPDRDYIYSLGKDTNNIVLTNVIVNNEGILTYTYNSVTVSQSPSSANYVNVTPDNTVDSTQFISNLQITRTALDIKLTYEYGTITYARPTTYGIIKVPGNNGVLVNDINDITNNGTNGTYVGQQHIIDAIYVNDGVLTYTYTNIYTTDYRVQQDKKNDNTIHYILGKKTSNNTDEINITYYSDHTYIFMGDTSTVTVGSSDNSTYLYSPKITSKHYDITSGFWGGDIGTASQVSW